MIPDILQQRGKWCVWKREVRDGKPTKVPYDAITNRRAETNNLETFTTFEIAEETFKIDGDYNGIGMLVSDGFAAVDIDHCVTDGELSDLAKEIIADMNSYTEFSPSRTGLRIIFQGEDLAYDKTKYYLKNPHNGVELYVCGMTNRFITMTGNTLYQYPVRVLTNDELDAFVKKYMSRGSKNVGVSAKLTDEQIIAKASANSRFAALFSGDMSAYNNDHSSADLALCNILAFWTGKDAQQIDSIFRKSALYRPEKWAQRDDYRQSTIAKAIADCDQVYDPASARKIWDRLDVPYLNTGEWSVDNSGVSRDVIVRKQPEKAYATATPIAPAAYLENADLGIHKVKLHYLYDNKQRSIIVDRETIANKNKIVTLANYGVNVTSSDAADLTRYLSDLERLNPTAIPHYKSVSRVGWVGDDFVPYNDDIKFDGEAENRTLYNALTQAGSRTEWVNFMRPLRRNKYLRLMMAASFASPLIERCNALPFVFHLWGETGGGKTVALMVAMSIWGNPQAGQLVRTMNMTNASMMSTAAFLYNLPFAGDELQTIKDTQHASYDKLIMQITEGIERGRMQYNKNLPTRHWKNAFLFTGEERCTNDKSGGGTQNRVFEVEFTDNVITDGVSVVRFINKNYGHAGKHYIEYVSKRPRLSEDYDAITATIRHSVETTDKQAAVAALILLGDKLATECLFPGETPLSVDDIKEFIKSDKEVSISNRAHEFIIGWLAMNDNKFGASQYGEVWGCRSGGSVYVIDTVLNAALAAEGYSFDAVKKDWAKNGWLATYQNKFKRRKGINGTYPYCVELPISTEISTDF